MRELSDRRRGRRRRWWLPVAVLVAIAAALSLRGGAAPDLDLAADLPGIGPRTMITAVAREGGRGVSKLEIVVVHGDQRTVLASREYATRPPWSFWGDRTSEAELSAPVGTSVIDGLVDGTATVSAAAWSAGTWLRPPKTSTETLELPVRVSPPRVGVTSEQHYPSLGGAEAVVYRVGEHVVRHGVQAGDAFFPGFALPGGTAGESFALFALPHDLEQGEPVRLVAVDDVGNRTERSFVDLRRDRPFRSDSISVSDAFIERVASEIEATLPSRAATPPPVERYLAINRDLRVENRRRIAELAADSVDRFLWSGPFQPLPNAQVMARFGDRRTYLYDGEEVDRQVHLGYDLASVRRAAVPAANDGVVVAAEFLGIYGNVVVIDHGYGLTTLYGHLSSIDVAAGQPVARGETIGRTGATGLAGGDHLHFAVFLHGVAVDPVEWLDADWIANRIVAKLGGALEGRS